MTPEKIAAVDDYADGSRPASLDALAAATGYDHGTISDVLAQASANQLVMWIIRPPGWTLLPFGLEVIGRAESSRGAHSH